MRIHDDLDAGRLRPPVASRSAAGGAQAVASRVADADAVLDLQRSAGNAAVAQLLADDRPEEVSRSPVLDVVRRVGGQPLDPGTRATMEAGLGADFGSVRVHADGAATESAKAVQAQAYTVGDDVVFRSDLYQPGTESGQRMLAHELTHVVQQRSGPVDGTPAGGGISVSDPSDRFERAAEASADRFVPSGALPGVASPGVGTGVQRQMAGEEGEEEELQGLFLQRADGAAMEEDDVLQGRFIQRTDLSRDEESAP